jgi:hypothetical protein
MSRLVLRGGSAPWRAPITIAPASTQIATAAIAHTPTLPVSCLDDFKRADLFERADFFDRFIRIGRFKGIGVLRVAGFSSKWSTRCRVRRAGCKRP